MPSIFVWKAKQTISSTNLATIQYYSGTDWFLEEHSTCSKSAVYLHQQALSNDGWMFDIKWMPNNWVGSHLLEHKSVPYSLIKKDNYAQLEQLGDWMRVTIHDVPHESRISEWATVQKWATIPQQVIQPQAIQPQAIQPQAIQPQAIHKTHSNYPVVADEPCLINLSIGSYTNTGCSRQNSYKSHVHRQQFYQKIK
jgi:hypothetical protein